MNDILALRTFLASRFRDRSPRGILETFPASILFLTIILTTAWITWGDSTKAFRPVLERFGVNYDIDDNIRIWRILFPAFIQPHPGIGWKMVVLLIVAFGLCELLAGSLALILAFFITDWGTTLLTSVVLRILSDLHVERATDAIPLLDAGSSAAAVGALTVGIVHLRPLRFAIAGFVGLLLTTLVMLGTTEFAPAVVHIQSVLIGGTIGLVLILAQRPGAPFPPARSTASRHPAPHGIAGPGEA